MKEQLKKSSKGKVDHYVIGVGGVKKAKSEALKKKKEGFIKKHIEGYKKASKMVDRINNLKD